MGQEQAEGAGKPKGQVAFRWPKASCF